MPARLAARPGRAPAACRRRRRRCWPPITSTTPPAGWTKTKGSGVDLRGLDEGCTFRDFFIVERSKTSEKRGQLGNNDRFRRPPIPSRIRQKLENPREIASSDIRKTRKVRFL